MEQDPSGHHLRRARWLLRSRPAADQCRLARPGEQPGGGGFPLRPLRRPRPDDPRLPLHRARHGVPGWRLRLGHPLRSHIDPRDNPGLAGDPRITHAAEQANCRSTPPGASPHEDDAASRPSHDCLPGDTFAPRAARNVPADQRPAKEPAHGLCYTVWIEPQRGGPIDQNSPGRREILQAEIVDGGILVRFS